jgi:hypothetical protein
MKILLQCELAQIRRQQYQIFPCSSARWAINFIPQLITNPTGHNQPLEVITHTLIILQEFNKHYKNLLGTKHTSIEQPKLTNLYQNDIRDATYTDIECNDHLHPLVDPITLDEVRHTVFSLPKDKVSGLDGYPIEFFQNYWDVVRDDVFQTITAFYYNWLDL